MGRGAAAVAGGHDSAWRAQLAADVRAGLTAREKSLPPKYFYDERGSALFERICALPEYYPTRAEREIIAARAAAIAAATAAAELVELGSGSAEKTRLLLSALRTAGTLRRYVPFDVDGASLARTADTLAAELPDVEIAGTAGDFEHDLGLLPAPLTPRLVAFLGGTIGNLRPARRRTFLAAVAGVLGPGGGLLLGTDLVKDPATLVAAYDDPAGVTAAFNRNVLAVLNRELGAGFDPGRFDHVALWNEDEQWIEMRLRSRGEQVVPVAGLGLEIAFAAGEEILTEISAKFTPQRIDGELVVAGLATAARWTDAGGRFALTLARSAA